MAFETPFVPGGLHFYFGPSGVSYIIKHIFHGQINHQKNVFKVLLNITLGENGHPAAKHVAMETKRGFDLAVHIVTMLNQVIY